MSSLIRPRLTSGRLSLLTSTFRLFIFRAVRSSCPSRFPSANLRISFTIRVPSQYRGNAAQPAAHRSSLQRRDATASGQNATETQAIVPAAIQLLMLALATLSISRTA